jgi:signal transduction histidine kinase
MEAAKNDNTDGHTITVNLPEEPIIVFADPVRLAQVFSNLLENAMKFTPTDGSIKIAAEQVNEQAVVRVRDTGIGIRRELQEGLFDMFAQAEPFAGGNGKGLG